jgi:hypothetical protein
MHASSMQPTTVLVRPRNLLLYALFLLAAFLTLIAVNGIRIGDFLDSIWGIFGVAIAFEVGRSYAKEKRILENPNECEGVVLERQRNVGYGRRRGYRIKYEFIAEDGKRYLGAASGTIRSPVAGQPIALIYLRDDPSQSLPVGHFWLHDVTGRF